MQDYLIYTDSAADIPMSEYEKYDIRIIPMEFSLNGETIIFYTNDKDRESLCDRVYSAMRQGADVHTSQITPYMYLESWRSELEAGHDILYVCFSSGLSATYENACSAAMTLKEDFPDRVIRVVDSLAATTGQGLFTVTACINREQGMSLEENASWLEANTRYLCHRFSVGDLDYLHKGGRVSAAVALIGGMLKIKPMLIIDDEGKLEVVSKVRGQLAAMKALVKSYKRECGAPGVPKLIYLTHSGIPEEAEKLKGLLQEVTDPETRIEIICETPIIGVHTGPEFFAICGYGLHRKEEN